MRRGGSRWEFSGVLTGIFCVNTLFACDVCIFVVFKGVIVVTGMTTVCHATLFFTCNRKVSL